LVKIRKNRQKDGLQEGKQWPGRRFHRPGQCLKSVRCAD